MYIPLRNIILIVSGLLVVGGVYWWFRALQAYPKAAPMTWGVSFSTEYAGYLKEDPKKIFTVILDDWKFRHIRLFAQWNQLQKESGTFDFTELDWLMDEADKRGAKVIMAIGQKTPRWPECHIPQWAAELSTREYEKALDNYLIEVVARYQKHPALEMWQVENEPYLMFGANCGNVNPDLLMHEMALVKRLDPGHPTMVSDSGELSSWRKTSPAGDYFGTTMYRVVWNKYIGYWNYDWLPAGFYRTKLWVNNRSIDTAFIMELQAEPWIPDKDIWDATIEEQYRSMSLDRLQKNMAFAERVGMPRAYLWGAEWWYWLRERGNNGIPDLIAQLKK